MVAVIGDITERDDYPHPLGPEKNFNESMYFNFFDRARDVGGFVRLGNRANEGYAEMTVCLFLPGGPVLFNYQRPEIHHNDAFDAGGMRFETIEPLQRLRTVYEGPAVYLEDPTQMANPRHAFTSNPYKRVALDLVHEAVGPAYGGTGADREITNPDEEFARAHYEQHMRARGTLSIDGDVIEVDGLGLRDHSWGPRYWQAIHHYRWLTINFGPDFGMMCSLVARTPEEETRTGVLVRGERLERIRDFTLDTTYDANGLYHRAFTATVRLESGEALSLEGVVKSFIPLRNRREGMVTHIGEGMTEYRCGEFVGYGLSEYLDQVEPRDP